MVVGAGHTGDEQGERQHSVQEMANGVQEAEHRSVSSAQSRSTSYSSNMDIESKVCFCQVSVSSCLVLYW